MFDKLPTITNIYKIEIVKSWKAEAFINTNTDININADVKFKKKKRLVYKTLKMWYKCFNYLNIKNILWLAVDFMSGIAIKGFKMMDFCKACVLADSK